MSTDSNKVTHLDNESEVNADKDVNSTNSTFEVVERYDVAINEETNKEVNNEINNETKNEMNNGINNEINMSNLSSIAPNALFNSFPNEYIDALIRRLNENKNSNINSNESKENINNNNNNNNNNNSIDKLKNIGGTLTQQLPTLFDTTQSQLTSIIDQFNNKEHKQEQKDTINEYESEDDEYDYEYEYYHTKINHDIEWNTKPNNTLNDDELFIISKNLFDINDNNNKQFVNDISNKNNNKNKKEMNGKRRKTKKRIVNNSSNNNNLNNNNNISSKKTTWTESLNSMLTHAKHRMYTMLANPSFKWDTRNNRHLFTFSDNVWIIGGKCYTFTGINNKQIIQSIVLDIYSKIWITYRSKFENILSSSYTSDAGWGCMLRTTQMMTAQALIILYFDYGWNLRKLSNNKQNIYYNILSLFNDSHNNILYPLSIHNMLSYGSVLYNKPVGHWYGPMQSCIMIKKCIEDNIELNNKIEVIVSDSQIIYKSDISLKKYALIFLPLRLGLDSLNINYIKSIKQCFHLKECIGIIGGKPQKSLYFIGYQQNNLFYLDPHTVFPTPNINKLLSKQKCVFHCQEINSLYAKQLDPSMAIAFFIKPNEKCLNSFWENAKKLMNHQYSIFSLAKQRPNYEKIIDDNLINNELNELNDDEWEKI